MLPTECTAFRHKQIWWYGLLSPAYRITLCCTRRAMRSSDSNAMRAGQQRMLHTRTRCACQKSPTVTLKTSDWLGRRFAHPSTPGKRLFPQHFFAMRYEIVGRKLELHMPSSAGIQSRVIPCAVHLSTHVKVVTQTTMVCNKNCFTPDTAAGLLPRPSPLVQGRRSGSNGTDSSRSCGHASPGRRLVVQPQASNPARYNRVSLTDQGVRVEQAGARRGSGSAGGGLVPEV